MKPVAMTNALVPVVAVTAGLVPVPVLGLP
jgi:hypothetical protein